MAAHQIVPDSLIANIQKGGHPDNYLKGRVGTMLSENFGDTRLTNSYQWDAVFADGDFYKGGMNGQGLYISPGKDVVIAWFAKDYTEIPMEAFARAIALRLRDADKAGE